MNSTEKVVALMKILGHEPYVYGVTELGEMIGCGKSGTFKLLSVLVKEGLAAQTADHKYTLGIMTYLLGKRYEENVGVVRAVRPYMQKLRDLTARPSPSGCWSTARPPASAARRGRALCGSCPMWATRGPCTRAASADLGPTWTPTTSAGC